MLENIKQQLPDYAKDIKLNLSNVLSEEGSAELLMAQIQGIALASALTTKNKAVIDNSGIAKTDFELYALAVSAINGCGMCIEAHTKQLLQQGLTKVAIQAAIRIAAVIHAVAAVLAIK